MKCIPVVGKELAHLARLVALALLPHSRLTQAEDTVVQHVENGNHTKTVRSAPNATQSKE